MKTENKKKLSFIQGITVHNPVFAAGLGIAPAVFMGSTLSGALTYAAYFSAVTFAALIISSFLPRRIPYAVRIILYTAAAAIVYIPVYIFMGNRLPADPEKLGVFLPMIVTGQFIVSASELRFFRMGKAAMLPDIISHIIGFDAAVILLGAVRELFSTGGINGELYGINTVIPVLGAPCGGFILIGLIGALIRFCTQGLPAPASHRNDKGT